MCRHINLVQLILDGASDVHILDCELNGARQLKNDDEIESSFWPTNAEETRQLCASLYENAKRLQVTYTGNATQGCTSVTSIDHCSYPPFHPHRSFLHMRRPIEMQKKALKRDSAAERKRRIHELLAKGVRIKQVMNSMNMPAHIGWFFPSIGCAVILNLVLVLVLVLGASVACLSRYHAA